MEEENYIIEEDRTIMEDLINEEILMENLFER